MSVESSLESLVGSLPEGITEGVALGTGMVDGYDVYESPVGSVAVTFNPHGVSSVTLAESGFEMSFARRYGRTLLRAEAPKAWRNHIPDAIEAGSPGTLPVDLRSVSGFQSEVLLRAAAIPRGEVRSYGWLANEVNSPGAARAVGSTMARNPIPLIIPCHRVVRADGHIGAYSLGGTANKRQLLDHEGAMPSRLEDLAAANIRVQADREGRAYHHPTCHLLGTTEQSKLLGFRSVEAAEAAGLSQCPVCRAL